MRDLTNLYDIVEEGQYLRVSFRGEVSEDTLYRMMCELVATPDLLGRDKLCDMRGVSTSLHYRGMIRVARFVAEQLGKSERVIRNGIVVDSDLGFGLARMYATLAEKIPTMDRIFTNLESAREWLTESDLKYPELP